VRAEIHCHGDLRVPENLHDHPRMDALGGQQGGAAMPQIVEPDPAQSGGLQRGLEAVRHGGTFEGGAGASGENEGAIMPRGSGKLAFLLLASAVSP
jgi:hypothetical protein